MLNNNGESEGLFNGAWMQSGCLLLLNNYSQLQGDYDLLVNQTTCAGSSDSLDPSSPSLKLCLRFLRSSNSGCAVKILSYLFLTKCSAGKLYLIIISSQNIQRLYSHRDAWRAYLLSFSVSCQIPQPPKRQATEDEGTDGALNLTSIT